MENNDIIEYFEIDDDEMRERIKCYYTLKNNNIRDFIDYVNHSENCNIKVNDKNEIEKGNINRILSIDVLKNFFKINTKKENMQKIKNIKNKIVREIIIDDKKMYYKISIVESKKYHIIVIWLMPGYEDM